LPRDLNWEDIAVKLTRNLQEIRNMKKITRRKFLRYGALGAAAAVSMPTIIRSGVLSANGAIAPGNQITIGQVGFGWIGGSHLGTMLGRKDVRYVAACDVNGKKLEEVRQRIEATYGERYGGERYGKENYRGCAAYRDYRQMLARQDLDAVIIATPDHWHALISIHAAQAGKDIYCEKPMTLTIREARAVVKTVRRYSRVFQTGSQQRSNVFGSFRQACEMVRMCQLEGRQNLVTCLRNHSRIILIGISGWDRFFGDRIIRSWQRSVGGPIGSFAVVALLIWAPIISISHNGLWVRMNQDPQEYIRLMERSESGLVSSMLMESS
jgi:hypothetical protein